MSSPGPVIQITYLTLKPSTSFRDESPAAKAWEETLSVLKQEKGCETIYWGTLMEMEDVVMLFVDWQTLPSTVSPSSSAPISSFVQTEKTHTHHVLHPSPFPPTVLSSSPVVELATLFAASPDYLSNIANFITACGNPEGLGELSYGAVLEDKVEKHAEFGSGVEGKKAFVLLGGWESREMHGVFRGSETFGKAMGELKGSQGAEIFHVEKITTIKV